MEVKNITPKVSTCFARIMSLWNKQWLMYALEQNWIAKKNNWMVIKVCDACSNTWNWTI
jgi:hypothetical protein